MNRIVAGEGVDHLFDGRNPRVRAIYDRLIRAAKQAGAVRQEPKKTCIHLSRRSAFAGIATRKNALVLTLKSASDIRSPRITKRLQASANRWYLEIRLDNPGQVDRELTGWLKNAIQLAD